MNNGKDCSVELKLAQQQIVEMEASLEIAQSRIKDLENQLDAGPELDQKGKHYLEAELYFRLQNDPTIINFLEQGSLDGIWYWDLDKPENEWMSPRFWTTLGYEPKEKQHLAAEWQGIIFEEDLQSALDNFKKHCADPNHPYDQIVRYRHKDGSVVTIRCRGIAIRDAAGKPVRMLGVHNDLSVLVALEDMRTARDTAEMANKSKSVFLANMSHEIRTPLNGIIGMLQLLNLTELDEEQGEYVEAAHLSSNRLNQLLADILDLSRVEAQALAIELGPLNLNDVATQTQELFESPAQHKGLQLNVHVDPQVPKALIGDSLRVQQVVSNLVGNAVKFTESGEVSLKIKPTMITGHSCLVNFEVSDTGIGIPEEAMASVFESFTQVSKGYTRTKQGAGLGLAITKKLTELMEGTMSVESDPGVGSRFIVSIKFKKAVGVLDAEAVGLEFPDWVGDGKKVLLVEDDKYSREALREALETVGMEVLLAGNGLEAIELVSGSEVDLVLMDIQLPVMNGVEAVSAIRAGKAGEDNRQIPIIALTAYAMEGDRETFLAKGVDGYVSKPVDLVCLKDEMDRVLS